MCKIEFIFKGKKRTHEFFFGIHSGDNGFSIKDERGVSHDCILNGKEVKIYGQDSDYLIEKTYAKVV